jgi:hypothetical protein
VPPLDAALAVPAAADVDIELPLDGLAWDLDLILLVDVGLVEAAAAVGTDIGEQRFVDLVDVRGGRPMGFGAVFGSRLASWFFRFFLGFALGKGSGLAFASPPLLFEQAGQALDLKLQFGDASL